MSKAAEESGLTNLAQNSDMSITVIRPPLVYGAGAKGNFKLLTRAVKLGVPLPFSSINNRRAFLAVENLVRSLRSDLPALDVGLLFFLLLTMTKSQPLNS